MTDGLTAYDPNNIFAKILRGDLPSHRLHEDAHTLAIMDVMPQAPGHCLVMPKAPVRTLLEASDEVLAALMQSVKKIAIAAKSAFEADGVTIMQFNEAAGGQTVFHVHVHVIPRHAGIGLAPHSGKMADPAMLAEQAARIKSHI
jgi:histidine triad (HIT) family protein